MHPADRHDPDHFAHRLAQLDAHLHTLPDKPDETALSTLRALWHMAAGQPLSIPRALDTPLPALDAAGQQRLDDLLQQRLSGTPLAHVTGRQHFAGLEMQVSPAALIPRTETELLAQAAIEQAADIVAAGRKPRVIDACTGAGNVALALASAVREAIVHGTDVDPAAVELARRNAVQLELADRIQWHCGDLLQPFRNIEFIGHVDLITCNPPYISSARVGQMDAEIAAHEPAAAFDGGPLGVSLLMRLLADAPGLLRPGGWLAFEVGLGQGPALLRRMQKQSVWDEVRTRKDDTDAIRVLLARRAPGETA